MNVLKGYKIPLNWWRLFKTRPWKNVFSTLDDVVAFSAQTDILGFNGLGIRTEIVRALLEWYKCRTFVETGTYYGYTAGFVRRAFGVKVFSSEVKSSHYLISRLNLLWVRGISIFRENSPDFLLKICQPEIIGPNPMFYLDAHWYEYLPLPDELQIIAQRTQRSIIIIDDFHVPGIPGFEYDEYDGVRIDAGLVARALEGCRTDYQVYLPNYDPGLEPRGRRRGFAVVLMGQPEGIPVERFPFNLLTKERRSTVEDGGAENGVGSKIC